MLKKWPNGDPIGICGVRGLTTRAAGNQLQRALCMEIIRSLVGSTGEQEAPGRLQLWETDSQVLRNEGVTATDKKHSREPLFFQLRCGTRTSLKSQLETHT